MKEILKNNWFHFKKTYAGKSRRLVIEDVERMISCGDYDNGYAEYSCMSCSETKRVAFTCKSRFCTSCGKVYVDNRAEALSNSLIKVNHRHMVFTIKINRRVLLQVLCR